jgi:outer membrane protein TolC
MLDEVTQSLPPITNTEARFDSFWDLSLEEAVTIALQNSKVVRGYGTPGLQGTRVAPGIDNLANGPQGAGTIYDVAVRESEPGFIGTPGQINPAGSILTNTALDANQGVEAALADFDAQLTSNLGWIRSDQPRNVIPNNPLTPQVFQQDQVNWTSQLAKRAANGTQLFARSVASYTANNNPLQQNNGLQVLPSVYQAALELEIRQPLLRGRGAFINRMPVVISRINTDQVIANFESVMQNMVTNVEIRYWDLHRTYRNVETAKAGRDAALDTWRTVNENYIAGKVPLQDESQARGQYYFFRSQVEQSWADLLQAESDLRWLLGVASSDGRLIRPVDEPTKARVAFDYYQTMDEALLYRPELRQERWEVKKRELACQYSKNSLLPNLNVSALYRWLGLGDRFANYDSNVPIFPSETSGALNELFGGDYQELEMNVEFGMPVGYRRELANVRNAQLKLARELARLEDMELDVEREVSQAMQALEANYQLAQTNFNSWAAYSAELEARKERYEAGTDPITFLLDAQRSRAQGEAEYYRAICEYNKLIALIHRRKGTILAYNNIHLDEGPWPNKAYDDAHERARARSASRPMNYGFTRPQVISQGPIAPHGDAAGEVIYADDWSAPMEYYNETAPGMILEEIPSGNGPDLTPQPENLPEPTPAAPRTEQTRVQRDSGRQLSVVHPQPPVNASPPRTRQVDWQRFGMTRPDGSSSASTRAVIRQVGHDQPVRR